jgi:Flp pilus assembly protein CpaB
MEVTQRRATGSSGGSWYSTRQGTLSIALVATLIAAGILVFALHRYRKSVETSNEPGTVLVANRFIEKGTSGAAIGVGHYFRTTKMLDKQVAQGALASSAALHGEVAAVDIYPGQQLTAADFTSGGLFYSKLPRNLRAVSVPVNTSHGMIGNIQTGDRVDVYASFKREGGREAFLRLVAPDVVVLDAGQLPSSGSIAGSANQTSQEANVVLEVDIHQAAELAFTADNGKVWLVLRPAHGTSPTGELIDEFSIQTKNPPVAREGKP